MCGRFTQDYSWEEVHDYYDLTGPALNLMASYNVAPTQLVHTICAADAGRVLNHARWGLVPAWWKKTLKDLPATFNARTESVADKPMFRHPFRHRRCLVPAGGFYEWKRHDGDKQPYYITRTDGHPLTMAGLWDIWRDPETGEEVRSCTILTTHANAPMREVHSRMPVVLEPSAFDDWLSARGGLPAPCADQTLSLHPVSRAVGNVRNNGPELIMAMSG